MAPPTSSVDLPWWHRRWPSLIVFLAVLAVLGLTTVAVADKVANVLPEVGKDQLGEDRWDDPLGVELSGDFLVAHIPECAAGSITRIALWDANSKPYWEVSGPATPMPAFIIGLTPGGFTEVVPYRRPPADTILRLVAFRRIGGAAGIRYQAAQLRSKRVVGGIPLSSYTIEGFQAAPVCSKSPTATDIGGGPDATPVTDLGGSTTTAPTTSVPG